MSESKTKIFKKRRELILTLKLLHPTYNTKELANHLQGNYFWNQLNTDFSAPIGITQKNNTQNNRIYSSRVGGPPECLKNHQHNKHYQLRCFLVEFIMEVLFPQTNRFTWMIFLRKNRNNTTKVNTG